MAASEMRPTLADPLDLGPRTMRNRIVQAPMSVCYADHDGMVTTAMIEHYARRAAGGAGMIITENVAVSAAGRQLPKQALITGEEHLPGLSALAEAVKREGALAVLQIVHAGRYAGPWERYEHERRLAPSAVEFELTPGRRVTPHEMTLDEIEEATQAFVNATRLAKQAGLDGVEIHGAQGMLLSSFQSPIMNRRTDGYGTDRNRLPREVVAAVVAEAGDDFLVGYHLFSNEMMDGGLEPPEAIENARELDALGLHFIMAIRTTFESLRASRMANPDVDPTEHDPAVAAALRAAVGCAIFANGGLATGEQAAAVLAQGDAQAVAVARPMFADPDWAGKVLAGEPAHGCACSPPLCVQTQLTGARCSSWPEPIAEQGYWGMSDLQR